MLATNKLIIAFNICICIFAGNSGSAVSQSNVQMKNLPHYDYRPYHFGFLLGLNKMDFILQPIENFHLLEAEDKTNVPEIYKFDKLYSVLSKPEYGFNIGIVSNLKLADRLDLRFIPTLSFGDRTVIFQGANKNGVPVERSQTIESTFLDFPLFFKYKSVRINNTRVYLIGGIKYTYDLASPKDSDDPFEELFINISKSDFYYEFGVGFDHYFYYFKFSAEIKLSLGLNDVLREDDNIFTKSIQNLNSNIIQLSFMFE